MPRKLRKCPPSPAALSETLRHRPETPPRNPRYAGQPVRTPRAAAVGRPRRRRTSGNRGPTCSCGADVDRTRRLTPGRLRSRHASVGFFSCLLVPRSVRRAVHPVRTAKRAVTPKVVKKAQRALHPIDNVVYGMERSLSTPLRASSGSSSYRHGTCPVKHRTAAAAAKCRHR
jgi:hypothetical protein